MHGTTVAPTNGRFAIDMPLGEACRKIRTNAEWSQHRLGALARIQAALLFGQMRLRQERCAITTRLKLLRARMDDLLAQHHDLIVLG